MSGGSTVAVLGTGLMGSAMVRNMLAAGHEVRVWNRSSERTQALADRGAVVASSPRDAVAGASVVVTMLRDGAVVNEVMRSAAPGLSDGVVWAEMSTVGVSEVSSLASLAGEVGAEFVDAPVLGATPVAEAGELVVLAAGPESVRQQVDPVFAAVGTRTQWLSLEPESGAAAAVKLVLNSWVLNLTGAVGESLALAAGLGVDPQVFIDAVRGGPLDVGYLHAKAAAIRSGDFTPTFTVDNASKDVSLILQAAEQSGVRLDLLAGMGERLARASADGHGGEDMAASYFAS